MVWQQDFVSVKDLIALWFHLLGIDAQSVAERILRNGDRADVSCFSLRSACLVKHGRQLDISTFPHLLFLLQFQIRHVVYVLHPFELRLDLGKLGMIDLYLVLISSTCKLILCLIESIDLLNNCLLS